MPRPFVTNVTFKGGEMVLTVELDKFLANKPVEISGYATQNSGGFATFYDIQSVGETPAGTVVMYVKATPATAFNIGDDVTVSLRASSVWVTVLGEGQDGEMPPNYQPLALPQGTPAEEGLPKVASPEPAATSR